MPADGPGLFTIGHSNQALDDFLGLLQEHRIEAVADVRTVPRSRYVPHFSAGPLREALAGRGIAYVPMGQELGGRPRGEEFYDEEGHVLYGRLAATMASTAYWPKCRRPASPCSAARKTRPDVTAICSSGGFWRRAACPCPTSGAMGA